MQTADELLISGRNKPPTAGQLRKVENCQAAVFLRHVSAEEHALVGDVSDEILMMLEHQQPDVMSDPPLSNRPEATSVPPGSR